MTSPCTGAPPGGVQVPLGPQEAEGAPPRCRYALRAEYAESRGAGEGSGEAGGDFDQQQHESDEKTVLWFCKTVRAAVGATSFCQTTASSERVLFTDLESLCRPLRRGVQLVDRNRLKLIKSVQNEKSITDRFWGTGIGETG